MWKLSTYSIFLLVPLFITMIGLSVMEMMEYKTGYYFDMETMETPMPSFTFCPFHDYTPLLPDQVLDILSNGTQLPILFKNVG